MDNEETPHEREGRKGEKNPALLPSVWIKMTPQQQQCREASSSLGGSGSVGKGECTLSSSVSDGRRDFSSDVSALMITLWNFSLQIPCKQSPTYPGETLTPAPSPLLAEALPGIAGSGAGGHGWLPGELWCRHLDSGWCGCHLPKGQSVFMEIESVFSDEAHFKLFLATHLFLLPLCSISSICNFSIVLCEGPQCRIISKICALNHARLSMVSIALIFTLLGAWEGWHKKVTVANAF